jgi:hypothetical protein
MANIKTKSDLDTLLNQVAEQVKQVTAGALAKAEPGKEPPGDKTPAGSSTEGTPSTDKPKDAAPAAAPEGGHKEPDGDEGSPVAPPAASASPSPIGDPGAVPPPALSDASASPDAGGGMPDPAALKAEFAQMPVEELKLYAMAATAALQEKLTPAPGGMPGAPGGSPVAPPVASAPGGSPVVPPTMKAEIKTSAGNGGQVKGGCMSKSEGEIRLELEKADILGQLEQAKASLAKAEQSAQEQVEKMSKAIGVVTEFVERKVLRKSIASTANLKPGSETQEKIPERVEVLNKFNGDFSRRSDLTKAERDIVKEFILDSNHPVSPDVLNIFKK